MDCIACFAMVQFVLTLHICPIYPKNSTHSREGPSRSARVSPFVEFQDGDGVITMCAVDESRSLVCTVCTLSLFELNLSEGWSDEEECLNYAVTLWRAMDSIYMTDDDVRRFRAMEIKIFFIAISQEIRYE